MPLNAVKLTYRLARRIAIAVVGSTILLIGVIMLVTPGPALIVIPIGLAVLGIEFAWARKWLRHVRKKISERYANHRGRQAEGHRERYREG